MRNIKRYSELVMLPTFEERFNYAELDGKVGEETFGWRRYANQRFYTSPEYRRFRRDIILRDGGCDLASDDHEIGGKIIIHHLNPITFDDIIEHSELAWNPEYVICVSELTHKAIHYSNINLLPSKFVERTKNDTCPWKR